MTTIERILVPVDFSPLSDAALEYALAIADECGAEVEVLYVWSPRESESEPASSAIFADTPEGLAMEQRLSAADVEHKARVCGRLEFGVEPSTVILAILAREHFDLVVMGQISASVAETAPCKVVTMPPPPLEPDETEAA
jgi:nucleotide-binding universal stress UspA family protein